MKVTGQPRKVLATKVLSSFLAYSNPRAHITGPIEGKLRYLRVSLLALTKYRVRRN